MLFVGIARDLAIDIADVMPVRALTWLFTAVALVVFLLTVVAAPVCLIEKLGPIASLSRGVALTCGNRLRIVGVAICGACVAIFLALVFGLIVFVLGGVLLALLYVILTQLALPTTDLTPILGGLVIGVLAALAPVVLFSLVPVALYLNLRAIEVEREAREGRDATATP